MDDVDHKSVVAVFGQMPKSIRAEGHKMFYVNGTKMAMSPWDLRIVFSNSVGTSIEETVNEEMVTVVMSPQHAKSALINWAKTIKAYEDTFGPIPDMLSILETMKKEKGPTEKPKRRLKVRP